jgi:hydrogenase expression/formation protein HypC
MCVAVPAQVSEVSERSATVLVGARAVRIALLALSGEPVAPGDWLLVHSGLALARLDEREALARKELIAQAGEER